MLTVSSAIARVIEVTNVLEIFFGVWSMCLCRGSLNDAMDMIYEWYGIGIDQDRFHGIFDGY